MNEHTITVQETYNEGHELTVFYTPAKEISSGTWETPPEYSEPVIDRVEKGCDELTLQEMQIYGCSGIDWLQTNYIDLRP